MAQSVSINPPNGQFVDMKTGKIAPEWWRFFNSLNSNVSGTLQGTVTTAPGSGLSGGGAVVNGVSLTVSQGGISDQMLRPSVGTSVLGRFSGSPGQPADIIAVANKTVLTRQDNQLAFRPTLDGIGIGVIEIAPLVSTQELRLASTPPATATATGVAGTITWDAAFLYVAVATNTWKRVALTTW